MFLTSSLNFLERKLEEMVRSGCKNHTNFGFQRIDNGDKGREIKEISTEYDKSFSAFQACFNGVSRVFQEMPWVFYRRF